MKKKEFIVFFSQLGNADLYNNYLQSLKGSITNRQLEVFWDLLVQGMLRFQFKVQPQCTEETKALWNVVRFSSYFFCI